MLSNVQSGSAIDLSGTPIVKKKVKCGTCKAKGILLACKCGASFCVNHLTATEHGCTFNYRESANTVLSRQLDNTGLGVKIEKI